MSVAVDLDYEPGFEPAAPPRRLRAVRPDPAGRAERLASVTTLHRLSEHATAAPLRLTRRGVRVLTATVAVLACLLVGAARLSAAGTSAPARPVPNTVTVRPGDTLWSIATRLFPQRDPGSEVAQLQRVNRLGGSGLTPGDVLRTH